IDYFGFDNGVNRAGRAERLRAHITNTGGATGTVSGLKISVPEGVTVLRGPEPSEAKIPAGGYADFYWEVRADTAGAYSLGLETEFGGYGVRLDWLENAGFGTHTRVPEPQPVETSVDVCAYYF